MINTVIHGDCLDEMKRITDKSIDMILCDLPYGTTACKWDTIIPFEPLWEQYKRIIKDNGAIVLTASQPFTSALVMSNIEDFKYSWIWNKKQTGNPFLARHQPLKIHEDVLVFNSKVYKPEMRTGKLRKKGGAKKSLLFGQHTTESTNDQYYPVTILDFPNERLNKLHPTQKPVALFEYLIKTYTNEGDTVLDNCAGSGTTAIACINTNRNYILIEKEQEYINIINKRLKAGNNQ
jgi:site-specific DNA-methyltransferase (adenine-specific)